MNPITIITAWRNERTVAKAVKDHDRAGLAVAVSLALTFGVTLLKGTKYAALASFLDPDSLTAVGVVVAGVIAGFGHWASRGAIAGVASAPVAGTPGGPPAGGQGPLDPPVGSQPADAGAPDPVRHWSAAAQEAP